jgi:hypothetical protein
MAYDTKKLITDADKRPAPQYYNKTADTYEAAEGSDGALHTKLTGRNVQQETTLQNAVSAAANGIAIYMGGADTLKITEISGTSTSRTIVFEISNAENGTYSPVQGVRLSDLAMATQTSSNGELWQIDGLAGLWFRARVSTVVGGNVTVKGKVVA